MSSSSSIHTEPSVTLQSEAQHYKTHETPAVHSSSLQVSSSSSIHTEPSVMLQSEAQHYKTHETPAVHSSSLQVSSSSSIHTEPSVTLQSEVQHYKTHKMPAVHSSSLQVSNCLCCSGVLRSCSPYVHNYSQLPTFILTGQSNCPINTESLR